MNMAFCYISARLRILPSVSLNQAQIGDKVTVELSNGQKYDLDITGTMHDLNAFPGNMVPLPTAYVSFQTLAWMGFPGQSNEIDIVTKDKITSIPELGTVASAIRQKIENRGLTVYSAQVKNADEHWAKPVSQSFTLILSGLGVFSLILSAFLVVNTISALIAQQKRQIGMMKAIGGTARQIINLYLVLVSFYGLLALFIGLPISLGLGYLFMQMVANLLNLDITNFYLPARVFFLELGAAILVPAIAAALPILGGVKISVPKPLATMAFPEKTRRGSSTKSSSKSVSFPALSSSPCVIHSAAKPD